VFGAVWDLEASVFNTNGNPKSKPHHGDAEARRTAKSGKGGGEERKAIETRILSKNRID
jgi:hypothetical protein